MPDNRIMNNKLKSETFSNIDKFNLPTRKKDKNKLSWIISSILAIIISVLISTKLLGFDVDCNQYLEHYEQLTLIGASNFDIGYEIIALITKNLSLEFFILSISITSISLAIKFKIWSELKTNLFGFLFYALLILPLHEHTQIRAAIATSLAYFGVLLAIHKNKVALGSLLVMISATIHLSTVLFLIPIAWVAIKIESRKLITTTVISSVGVLYFTTIYNADFAILNDRVSYYLNPYGSEQKLLTAQNLLAGTILLVGFIFYESIINKKMQHWYGFSCVLYIYPLLITSFMPTVAGRIFELSLFSYTLWGTKLEGIAKYIASGILFTWSIYAFYRHIYIDGVFDGITCKSYN